MPTLDDFTFYVINIKERKDKLEHIQRELQKLKINPSKIIYVNGIIPPDKGNFDRIGSHGCTLSHLECWKQSIKNRNIWSLFIEDDCVFSDTFRVDFNCIWKEINDNKEIYETIFFNLYKNKKRKGILKHHYVKNCPLHSTTECYFISWSARKKYLSKHITEIMSSPIDGVLSKKNFMTSLKPIKQLTCQANHLSSDIRRLR